jgi:hypothetical protein
MAYLARIEQQTAQPIAFFDRIAPAAQAPEFSDLEWSVIRLARVDGLSTLREPGPFRRFIAWLTGTERHPELANERLEALRRMAVLSWHFGFSIPGSDVADFLAAGFTPEQYELMVSSIRAAINATSQRIH